MPNPPAPEDPLSHYAGVDLGSNSFHLVLGRVEADGRITFVDRVKEAVRLAGGLGTDGRLSEAAVARALDCLGRFGERLAGLPAERVRVVGTNTLRRARDAEDFVDRAEGVLGHRIDIISGLEEARLVYRGVSASFDRAGPRLVVDIGGGSTELILGDQRGPVLLDSLYLGCVGWTERFFPGGRITAARFDDAELAARRELAPVIARYREAFEHAVGSSGTARAIDRTLLATGWEGVTPAATAHLRDALVRAGRTDRIALPEISAERAQVLPGGLAILRGVMRALHVPRMTTVDTALREGLVLDLAGRGVEGDIREGTVRRLQERFGVDAIHASQVARTALSLHDQVRDAWALPEDSRHLLDRAARLHELGLFLRYSGHHK
ncbi:MAG: Ppx/GppA family phosphatase, partial [Deltaproteobacteria bacterium]